MTDRFFGLARMRPPLFLHAVGFILAALSVFCILRQLPAPPGMLEIDLSTEHEGGVQLFFDRGSGLSEADSEQQPTLLGHNRLTFRLPAENVRPLRFDPGANDKPVRITKILLHSTRATPPINLPLEIVTAGEGIAELRRSPQHLDVLMKQGTNDPQLWLSIDAEILKQDLPNRSLLADAFVALILATLLFAAFQVLLKASDRGLIVPGLTLALGLAIAMAAATTVTQSVQPDEFFHLACYRYFLHHWLPPAVSDPAIIPTMSVYGYSYLFELDVVYALDAYLTSPFLSLFDSDLHAARSFNIVLLAGLVGMAAWRRSWALCLAALLVTPQAWYLFSYFSGDALSLTLAFVCAALVGDRHGGLTAYLQLRRPAGAAVWLFVLALGLLLVSKRNYLPLVPALALWLAICHLRAGALVVAAMLAGLALVVCALFFADVPSLTAMHVDKFALAAGLALLSIPAVAVLAQCWRDPQRRPILLRLAVVFGMAIAVAMPRVGYDWWINAGPGGKSDRIEAALEQHASHDFKPSTLAQGAGAPGRAMASKGAPLEQVLTGPSAWPRLTAISAFGVYGHFAFYPPGWTYPVLALCALALFLLAAYALWKAKPDDGIRLLLVVLGTSTIIGLISLLHSWTFDLQPQGRYLLPILPMLGILFAAGEQQLPRMAFRCLLAVSILVSALSFAGFAIPPLTAIQ